MDEASERKQRVIDQCRELEVATICLWFTDVLGRVKNLEISPRDLPEALAEGVGFDGSSVEGFARIEESDMVALPDASTFAVLPWRSGEYPVARMICDIVNPDGSPYASDPRYALRRMIEKARGMGYDFYIGPELEFFYFNAGSGPPEGLDRVGYFDLTPQNVCVELRRETVRVLECMGIAVEAAHHEVAASQHEIDLRYDEALRMADHTVTYRVAVKQVAARHGVYATFMPKPLFGSNGSGMHVHQSLFRGTTNAFFDPDDPYHLSREARQFGAGLMKYAPEMCAVIAQTVNSYKRLVPGFEAPCYICWGRRNRSAMLRVPVYKPGNERATRVEFRAPDPACNPYLAYTVMLAAGLQGIEDELTIPDPVERDVYALTPEERHALHIESLPRDLGHAIDYCERSPLVMKALGEDIFEKFVANKKIEWDEYRVQVTGYELERYLPVL